MSCLLTYHLPALKKARFRFRVRVRGRGRGRVYLLLKEADVAHELTR